MTPEAPFTTPLATVWQWIVFVLLQPPLGALVLIFIARMTGGQWYVHPGAHLRRFAAFTPWVWLLLLPLLWVRGGESPPAAEHDAALAAYFSFAGRLVRFLLTTVLLGGLSRLALRGTGRDRWAGPVGLIVLVFTLHLAAVDWLVTRREGWYSTGFPLIWLAGNTISALALALVFTLRRGVSPAAPGTSGRPEGIDWGNLLLAAVLFWTYVSFTHFLIMWMGNLASEIGWYAHRATPGWKLLISLIALGHFAVPLLLLFFRNFKQSSRGLGGLAAALVVLQAAHLAWFILP